MNFLCLENQFLNYKSWYLTPWTIKYVIDNEVKCLTIFLHVTGTWPSLKGNLCHFYSNWTIYEQNSPNPMMNSKWTSPVRTGALFIWIQFEWKRPKRPSILCYVLVTCKKTTKSLIWFLIEFVAIDNFEMSIIKVFNLWIDLPTYPLNFKFVLLN